MRIESQALVEEFYDKIKDKYPGLTFEDCKLICYSPFLYTRKMMESGNLPVIRLKYFGTFMVYQGTAQGMLNKMNQRFKEMRIDPKFYFEKKAMLEKHLAKNITDESED